MKKIIVYIILILHITTHAIEQDSSVTPSYPEGIDAMNNFIKDNLYLNDIHTDTIIKGNVITNFIVRADGNIDSIIILKGLCCGINDKVIEVVAKMPKWNPATINDIAIDYKVTLPLKIYLDINKIKESDSIYTIIEQKPEFPGGTAKLMQYLITSNYNLDYKSSGILLLEFIIEKDGSISNIKVLRSVSPSIDAAGIRVVSNMPKWQPGMINDKPVRVKYVLPIQFKQFN